ncbi:hypothetical protein [Sphaerisporangium sp. TRM90804]|uniref:hypothetical protein n=1 Tax=Sphaerisporangium sp. TRM90804 TaxID=3031113 RepID=UPI002446F102|nr:hypothetical protein [Sphaerisporangium sp. TRM90804]MDH2424179.1 hypothetical protein [Sphaerisporangium sp. TRM90804]
MDGSKSSLEHGWVPSTCTLSADRRPLRLAEFDALFARSVRVVDRVGADRLRLELAFSPAVAAATAELMARESGCCSFFVFTLTISGERLGLEVGVPERNVSVLDALQERAMVSAGRPL